ncbi:MAG TPA: SDR family oxidoreductase [Gemmatimonadales bacterium]|nr:SDR family oxidoreductase [Gemmatimonadales bacterium]
MARYLVTGAAGFIGSHVAAALLARGEQVRILDNFSTGRRQNLEAVSGAEVIEGDVRSYHIIREAVDGCDFVLHQAALPSVPRSVKDPITSNEVNVVGTLNVLDASRDAKVARLIYASSSSIYGRNPALPKKEDMMPQPMSPYAVSKLAGEHYCRAFFELYGFETVMLRYFNVFGPRQDPHSQYSAVIPKFIDRALRGGRPEVNGDGSQTRDFTYVANVVQANLLACEVPAAAGRVFNVAAGQRYSLLDLLRALSKVLGTTVEPEFASSRMGDVPHSYADVNSARSVLGYDPTVGFPEGLRLTVQAMRGEHGQEAVSSGPPARLP